MLITIDPNLPILLRTLDRILHARIAHDRSLYSNLTCRHPSTTLSAVPGTWNPSGCIPSHLRIDKDQPHACRDDGTECNAADEVQTKTEKRRRRGPNIDARATDIGDDPEQNANEGAVRVIRPVIEDLGSGRHVLAPWRGEWRLIRT